MAVDRGGLRYIIDAQDQFHSEFTRLIGDVRKSRTEILKLQRTARRGIRLGDASRQLRTARKEASALSKDMEKVGRETGLVGKALKEEVDARRQLANQTRKANVETRKARKDAEEQFKVARRTAGQTRSRRRAEEDVTKTIDKRTRAEQRARAAKERSSELTERERRRLQAVTEEQKDALRTQERLERVQRRRSSERIQNLSTEERLQRRLQQAEERRRLISSAVQRGRVDLLNKRELNELKAFRSRLSGLGEALQNTQNRANRVSFTFRRLFGILAAFTVVRELIQLFNRSVAALVRVNAEIEQAQLGIASLFLAVGNIRDPFGDAVDSAEGLVLAQKEARRQTELLRQDALRTTATFRTLLDTFQVAIAPGLSAGLDIDQVREFTVQISQAAAAIGLAQNQLAEEIRSILQGTIQARTTRIAVALGITNEDIRNAREAGVLAEFLTDRFIAFNEAGKASFNTFNGLVARIQDGFELLLQSGGVEFFDEVKQAARDLFNLLVDQDPLTDAISPAPGAVLVVRQISQGLAQALSSARGIAQNLDLRQAVRSARSLGEVLAEGTNIIAGITEGFVQGIADVQETVGVLVESFKEILGIREDLDIRSLVRLVTRIATIAFTLQLLVSSVTGLVGVFTTILGLALAPLSSIVSSFSALVALSTALNISLAPIFLTIGAIVGLAAAILLGIKKIVDEVVGGNTKLSTFAKILAVGVFSTVKRVGIAFRRLGLFISSGFKAIIIGIGALISELLLGPVVSAARLLQRLGIVGEETVESLDKARSFLTNKLLDLADDTKDKADDLKQEIKELKEETQELLKGVLLGAEDDPTVEEAVTGFVDKVKGRVEDSVKELVDGISRGVEGSNSLSEAFDSLSPSARRAVTTLESLSEVSKRIRDNIRDTADDLRETRATLGLSGAAEDLTSSAFRSRVQFREDAKKIDEDIRKLQQQIADVTQRRLANEGRISNLNKQQQSFLGTVERQVKRIRDIERETAELSSERSLIRARLARQREEGLSDEAESTKEELREVSSEISRQEDLLSSAKNQLDNLGESSEKYGLSVQQISDLLKARIELGGQEKGLQDDLNESLRQRTLLERRINQVLAQRQAAEASSASFDLRQENRESALDLAQKIFDFENRNADVSERLLENSRLQVILARRRLDITREEGQRNLNALRQQRERALSVAEELESQKELAKTEEERESLQENINAQKNAAKSITGLISQTQGELNLKLREGNLLLAQARERAEEVRRGLERPLREGLIQGIEQFVQDVRPLFEQISGITKNALEEVSRTGAQVVANIFDPRRNANLRQAVGQTLLSIGQQIVQTLISTLLARFIALFIAEQTFEATKAAQNASLIAGWASVGVQWSSIANRLLLAAFLLSSSGVPEGFAEGGPVGRAEGGPMPRGREAARAPAGLHPSDKIPIWAAAGEFMVRASSAAKYGHDALQKINEGLVDPFALRSLAASGSASRRASSIPRRGLVSGGPVISSSPADSATSFGADLPQQNQSVAAYIVPDELAAQRLLKGGKQAFVRFMDENGFVRR